MTNHVVWLEYCESCKRKHYMILRPCPSCGGRSGELVPTPLSDKVADTCRGLGWGECTGCEAYREHCY